MVSLFAKTTFQVDGPTASLESSLAAGARPELQLKFLKNAVAVVSTARPGQE